MYGLMPKKMLLKKKFKELLEKILQIVSKYAEKNTRLPVKAVRDYKINKRTKQKTFQKILVKQS